MSVSSNLGLPLLAAGQAQKHVTVNEQVVILDDVVQLAIIDRDLTAPPPTPNLGDRYLIPAAPTGVWSGKAGKIASWSGFSWEWRTPKCGWLMWVSDEARLLVFDSVNWIDPVTISQVGATFQNLSLLGVNATADSTNRLVVKSQASLFDHTGSDHRQVINRNSVSNSASTVYQTAYSGRAEMGLVGDNNFHVRSSPDGSSWNDAIIINSTTARVAFPQGMPEANLLLNGDFQINQRAFAGGTLATGNFGFDRWKAIGGSASLSLSGYTLTLSSGKISQPIEPQARGVPSFASTTLTLSVENLTGGSLSVGIGSATGTITPGPGRRSVTLTTSASDTGTLIVTLEAAGSAITFSKVRLEPGTLASAWIARSLTEETLQCQRYFWRIGGQISLVLYAQANGNYFFNSIALPVRMRATPTVSRLLGTYGNIFQNDINNISSTAQSDQVLRLSIRSGGAGESYANFEQINLEAEL